MPNRITLLPCCLALLLIAACSDGSDSGSKLSGTAGSAGSAAELAIQSGPSTALELRLDQAQVRGHAVADGVREFQGIAYAARPTGALRWAPPQPLAASALLDAASLSARCPQASNHGADVPGESEDCVYLNVWAPPSAERAAVMVWIHGGGNRDGTASELASSGALLAARYGVVVVTLNYRLGVLGFFAHPELRVEGGSTGNQGLWDQQQALRWVQRNIAAFGGDPARVTIFGESAGSTDVCLHMASPGSRGLFARAISESGGCTTRRSTAEEGERYALRLAERLGCTATPALDCLRFKSVSELYSAADALAATGTVFGPIVDGDFTPEQPRALYDRNAIAQVPYMLGSNTDEGTGFTINDTSITDDMQYLALLRQRLSADPEQVAALYPVSDYAQAKNPYQAALARAYGDGRLVCGTLDVAVRSAQAGLPVFMYNFDIPLDGDEGLWGAAHAAEIPYVFGTWSFTPEQRAVSDRMQRYWTQFAEHGDPNSAELEAWPRFTQNQNVRVNLGPSTTVVTDFRARECAFWREQYDRAF
jgi:para-nitrobenzyl esterase